MSFAATVFKMPIVVFTYLISDGRGKLSSPGLSKRKAFFAPIYKLRPLMIASTLAPRGRLVFIRSATPSGLFGSRFVAIIFRRFILEPNVLNIVTQTAPPLSQKSCTKLRARFGVAGDSSVGQFLHGQPKNRAWPLCPLVNRLVRTRMQGGVGRAGQ